MHSPKILIATMSAVSLIGAATFAFAQTPSSQPQAQTGNSGTMQRDGQTGNPSSTMTPNSSTSTPRSQDSTATGMGSSGNMGTSSTDRMQRDGSTSTNSTNSGNTTMQNDNTRSATDGSTMRTERMARADRN